MNTDRQPTTVTPVAVANSEAILRELDYYMVYHTKLLVHRHSSLTRPDLLDMEADELVQRVRIKFWLALNKYHIEFHRAYLKRIIHSEFHDMKRQQNAHALLPLDEDWVGYQFDQLENGPDPADELEQRLDGEERLEEVIQFILDLPPRQRSAITCLLLEQIDDPVHLVDLFRAHKVNIEALQWPAGKIEKKLLQASLYIARQALARHLNIDTHKRKRRRA